jgi:hypothetical protein
MTERETKSAEMKSRETRGSDATQTGRAPGRDATPGEAPAPLGKHPSSEEILDTAVDYTFPASDPTAIGAGIHAADDEEGLDPEAVNRLTASRPKLPDEFPFPRSPR